MSERRGAQLAVAAGLIGPLLLGVAITALTLLQYDFMRSLRWHPTEAPTTDWPSGLALGPHGAWMAATFVVAGGLLLIFARGLAPHLRATRAGWAGARLLQMAGLAMVALSSPTDPTFGPGPATLTGRVHDGAYGVLALSLSLAMVSLSLAFRADQRWRGYQWLTLAVALLVGPAFVIKGFLFYGLLLAVIIWFEALALRLWQLERGVGDA